MAERPVALEGPNLMLSVLVCLLWIAVGLVFLGPGQSSVLAAQVEVGERTSQVEQWNERFANATAISESERRDWDREYAYLSVFGAPGDDELSLTAWIAKELRIPSLRGLEVTSDSEAREDDNGSIEVHSPAGDETTVLEPVSVHVRFDSLYADLSLLLGRIESGNSALRIRRIEFVRHFPEIRVKLDVDLWTHHRVEP